MPLFYTHNINDTTRLAIWQIAEEEGFFLEKVPISRAITHPHKRLQHLAGRYLLQYLFPNFPLHLIQIADTRKPYLPNESHHFSISHCGNYAAAIVSTTHRTGLDIEIPVARIARIQYKFLSEKDTALVLENVSEEAIIEQLTLAWSAKESIFKWYALGEMDFRKHMFLTKISIENEGGFIDASLHKAPGFTLQLSYRIFHSLVLSWLATEQ